MGWFGKKFTDWAIKTQRREMNEFTARLRAMDSFEIAPVVVRATHSRISLDNNFGWVLLDPIGLVSTRDDVALRLGDMIRIGQEQGDLNGAAGLMVWLHTVRAAKSLDLRQDGRDMWRQLARGFPHCEAAAADLRDLLGIRFEIDNFDRFPVGLSPDPL